MPHLQGLIFDLEGTLIDGMLRPTRVHPHVPETLAAFHGKGIKLAICTNRSKSSAMRILEALKLNSYFSFIAGHDSFAFHKPHPAPVLGVIEALHLPQEACAMIGDGPGDVAAAHGAGIKCLVIAHDGSRDALGSDGVIGHFKDLPEALGKLGFNLGG